MVRLSFLGGTREVGRNAVLIESVGARLLLDYGVMLDDEPGFPSHVRATDIDGVVVTHAHLDHSGGVPIFYLTERKPVFITPVTAELVRVLIKDFIKLSGYYLPFEYLELESMMRCRRDLHYGMKVRIKDLAFTPINAGHIPGSFMVDVEAEGRRILYTADINTIDTRLVRGARIPKRKYDAVIIESTYATQEHPERRELEEEFIKEVKLVLDEEGRVLVPAFAVGRSQEMLSVLYAHGFRRNVYIDGMAREVNEIFLSYPDYLKAPRSFMKALSTAKVVRGWRDRREALKRSSIIVAPSGMLQGGTAVYYMERLALDERSGVFLVSFQIPGTRGAKLLETGRFTIGDGEEEVKARVRRFDFSSHAGMTQLHEFLKGLRGEPKVYVIHGEEENCKALTDWAADELGLEAQAPTQGDEVDV
ncbi:MAG: beta-lactamase domain protein [Candidatus Bathyarchaeota archaeon B23]|nr:MAG: beta-lactamase domain protein [Candidatus Bathyarchaeota archaeon B23]